MDSKKEPVKKPALSMLMPDKTPKAVAARNLAVKRMFTASPKRGAKSKPVVKISNTRTISKTSVAKAVKKSTPTRIRTRTKSEIKIESKVISSESAITLPERISVRAQEKTLAILSTITKDFKHSAERVSYVAGFCFVVFGSYLSLSFSGALPDILTPQVAQLISGTNSTNNTIIAPTTWITNYPKPTFSLHDPLPPVIETISKHTIEVTNAELTDATLYSIETGQTFDAQIEEIVDNTFRLIIDPNALAPSRYVLKVRLSSIYDDSKYIFKVGEFQVRLPVTAAPTESNGNNSSSTSSTTTDTDLNSSETTTANSDEALDDVPIKEVLTVTTAGSVLSGRSAIHVVAPTEARIVELFVRPLKSSTKRFIGLAEKHGDWWQYFFNTVDVPNGEYEIVARTKVGNEFLEDSTARILISNFTPSPSAPVNPTPEDVTAIEPEVEMDADNSRSFSDAAFSTVGSGVNIEESASSTEFETALDIDSVVGTYRNDIEDALKRYAVARQSENPLMLELAERELQEMRNIIVHDVLLDSTLSDLGDDVDTILQERFVDIKNRIDTFEELRRTATERASAFDRDRDGISDFDEANLYQSDPDKSDTDNDGVTDGIEVMGGFDPLDPQAEVIVAYEMPQDTVGLIEDDLLKIEGVSPVIKTDDPTVAPTVQAEIRGQGLPNSFVTIYVFSAPTIVTVRTSEDGSFVYTFEKELEDGEHEIYVAVTDNTGAIMARSNPFKFIKKAEAFSPVAGPVITPPDNTLSGIQIFGTFNVAIGLGILAFGMILLMLGATLKERQGFLMTSPKNNINA